MLSRKKKYMLDYLRKQKIIFWFMFEYPEKYKTVFC